MSFKLYAEKANQQGVMFLNGAQYQGGSLLITGNFETSSSTQTSAVITVAGTVPTGHVRAGLYSQVVNCHVETQVEINGGGAHGPTTISYGDAANNQFIGEGILGFVGTPSTTSNWTPALSYGANNFVFSGIIFGDANLSGGSSTESSISLSGALTYPKGAVYSPGNLQINAGDFFDYTLAGATTIAFSTITCPAPGG